MTRVLASVLAVLVLGASTWACATTGTGGSGVSLSATRYSAADLDRVSANNLYDWFRQHHLIRVGQTGTRSPLAFRHRGSYVPARLYVNDSEVASPISFLRQTHPQMVASLEIRDPGEASSIYGGHGLFAVIMLNM